MTKLGILNIGNITIGVCLTRSRSGEVGSAAFLSSAWKLSRLEITVRDILSLEGIIKENGTNKTVITGKREEATLVRIELEIGMKFTSGSLDVLTGGVDHYSSAWDKGRASGKSPLL